MGIRKIALALTGILLGLLLLAALGGALDSCNRNPVPVPDHESLVKAERDWYTSNEVACCPGDWDGDMYYTLAGGAYITRTTAPQYIGDYSYEHYSDCPDTTCWAFNFISCTTQMDEGYMSAHVRFKVGELPGAGVEEFPLMSAFEINTVDPPNVNEVWELGYDSFEDYSYIRCYACFPDAKWLLSGVVDNFWHQFEVYWYLPEDIADSAVLRVWQDGILLLDATGLDTDAGGCGWYPATAAGVGVKEWDFVSGDECTLYVDNVTINGCDEPMPTPTPVPGVCHQYGHAATLNISTDCSALIRFDSLQATVPMTATITSATLHLYGVAMEEHGQWIYASILRPIWGELTADWCNKRMGVPWAVQGARGVPIDRWGGFVALFEAKLGWMYVELPTDLVEEWLLTSAVNPGLIFYSETMLGTVAFASREWYDGVGTYAPRLVVSWE